jgi:hypothetical protein
MDLNSSKPLQSIWIEMKTNALTVQPVEGEQLKSSGLL